MERPDRTDHQIDRRLDARGLRCPEPLLRTRLALRDMRRDQCLEVMTDDPLAGIDLQVFCDRSGHLLIGPEPVGDAQRYCIVVGDSPSRESRSGRPE